MARALEYGDEVTILGGMAEFIGRKGFVLSREDGMYCVRLDRPVEIPEVGEVTSDLWERKLLRKLRG